jgi:hypothetical protein
MEVLWEEHESCSSCQDIVQARHSSRVNRSSSSSCSSSLYFFCSFNAFSLFLPCFMISLFHFVYKVCLFCHLSVSLFVRVFSWCQYSQTSQCNDIILWVLPPQRNMSHLWPFLLHSCFLMLYLCNKLGPFACFIPTTVYLIGMKLSIVVLTEHVVGLFIFHKHWYCEACAVFTQIQSDAVW